MTDDKRLAEIDAATAKATAGADVVIHRTDDVAALYVQAVLDRQFLLSELRKHMRAAKQMRERCIQIARDTSSDEPEPGTWNEACEQIAQELDAITPQDESR